MAIKKGDKERKKTRILGINLDIVTQEEALGRAVILARERSNRTRPALIVTPNPEIVGAAQEDSQLANILNQADLAVADGIGLVAAAKFLSLKTPKNALIRFFYLLLAGLRSGGAVLFGRPFFDVLPEPVPGRLLLTKICHEASRRGLRVFFLGGLTGVAASAAAKIKQELPQLEIEAESGPWLAPSGQPQGRDQAQIEAKTIEKINRFPPDFLFVGFGPPKQEKWLMRNLPRLKVGVAMTVGGAFDYLSGRQPPQVVAQAGLEWLWRLLRQPWRLRRILTAFPGFPVKIFFFRLKNPSNRLN